MDNDHWRGIRLAIVVGLAAVSAGIFLGIRWGALSTLHYCGTVATGGGW